MGARWVDTQGIAAISANLAAQAMPSIYLVRTIRTDIKLRRVLHPTE